VGWVGNPANDVGTTMKEVNSDEEEQRASEVKTVPPPAGESDAYNAPTRVADLDASTYATLLEQYGAPLVDAAAPAVSRAENPSTFEPARLPSFPAHVSAPAETWALPTAGHPISQGPAPPTVVAPLASPQRALLWTLLAWMIAASVVVMVAALAAMWLTQ
jgi:hypothetical protein